MTTSNDTTAGAGSRAPARVAPPLVAGRRSAGRVPPAERVQLSTSVGALLRVERLAAGYGTRRLAAAIGCDRRTVQRLEAGQLRPRRCLLAYLAAALAPDDPEPLRTRLIAAAGPLLRPDTPGAIRRRQRAAHAALIAGRMPLPSELDRRIRLHRAASTAWWRATNLINSPGALNDPAVLAEASRLLAESRQLRAEAGPPVVILAGRERITAGWPI